MQDDHRKYVRIGEENLVSYQLMSQDQKTVEHQSMGIELDYSCSGLHLELASEVKTGDWLRLSIAMVDHVVETTGQVAWVKAVGDAWEVGYQFSEAQPELMERVYEWLMTKG